MFEFEDRFEELIEKFKEIQNLPADNAKSALPEWLHRIREGNKFNKEREAFYDFNEVYLFKPSGVSGKGKYVRLDSYIHGLEIVSRKFTQFDDIQLSTAKKYIKD